MPSMPQVAWTPIRGPGKEAPLGKERGKELSGVGHRVEGLGEGRSGVGGNEGRGTFEGHRREGAPFGSRAPSGGATPHPATACEGGIVHWKQEDKELSLSQGSLEKEEWPGGSLERSEVTQ